MKTDTVKYMRITVLNKKFKATVFLSCGLFFIMIVELVNIFDISFHYYPLDV